MTVDPSSLRVVKLGYSSRPWRLVAADGREVWHWEKYPGPQDLPPIQAPLAFDRKRDAVAKLAALTGSRSA